MISLLRDIDKLHTTPAGAERIRLNLGLETCDVVAWCKEAIVNADAVIRQGKNWYAYKGGAAITVNAESMTIITAHKTRGW